MKNYVDILDLQLLDWVHNTYKNKDVQWDPHDFFIMDNDHMTSNVIIGKNILPIKLSLEFFKKNGFEYYQTSDGVDRMIWMQKDNDDGTELYDITIYLKDDAYSVRIRYKASFDGTITSVHEFQHALRVCGLRDLADNLKIVKTF